MVITWICTGITYVHQRKDLTQVESFQAVLSVLSSFADYQGQVKGQGKGDGESEESLAESRSDSRGTPNSMRTKVCKDAQPALVCMPSLIPSLQ